MLSVSTTKTDYENWIRNRPDIRLNPDPAGYPASISGSGSGSGFKNFAGFFAGYFIFKMYFKNLEMHIFRHILTRIPKNQNFFHVEKSGV